MKTLFLLAAFAYGPDVSLPQLVSEHPDQARTEQIGASRGGQQLQMLILADPIDEAAQRPAILIVSGLDGRHTLGPALTMELAQRLLGEPRDVLEDTTFYILPLANPDAAQLDHRRGTIRVIDQDRDGAVDEDPPTDLDGNGVITMMRRANPPLEDPPTHLPDPGEPRLMKKPNHDKHERATHSMYIEGLDTDGDGLIGEDGPEGVDLDRNFMHLWPEHDLEAGPYPLSEYESRALAEFVLEHPNIIAAVVYGRHDNLVHEPNTKDMDITGRIPRELAGADKAEHKKVSESYKEVVGQERSARENSAGSFHGWLYAHRGIPTYASTGWGRPEPSEEPAADDDGEHTEDPIEPSDKESAAWLAYSDRDREGTGFIEWTTFDHPQLGEVEIGGWVPGFMMNPPAEAIPELADKHATWLRDVANSRARLEVIGPEVEPLSPGVARIRIGLRNDGATPTRSHQAVRTQAQRPTNVHLRVQPGDVLDGNLVEQIEMIKPGELVVKEWVVRLKPGEKVKVEIDDPVLATHIVRTAEVDS